MPYYQYVLRGTLSNPHVLTCFCLGGLLTFKLKEIKFVFFCLFAFLLKHVRVRQYNGDADENCAVALT